MLNVLNLPKVSHGRFVDVWNVIYFNCFKVILISSIYILVLHQLFNTISQQKYKKKKID